MRARERRSSCRKPGRGRVAHAGTLLAVLLALACTFPSRAEGAPRTLPSVRLEELKTRGILPLWVGVDGPLASPELDRTLRGPSATPPVPDDLALLADLRILLTPGVRFADPYGPLGLSSPSATFTGGGPSFSYSIGWQAWPGRSELQRASVSFSLGNVDVLVGRSPVHWGPGAYAGLAYSEYAGGVDLLRVRFEPWPRVRYSKFFGRVDDRVSTVGQRVDILLSPTFRLGVGDAVLMVGSSYWVYLLNPLPPLNALDVGFAIFDKELHRKRNDNGAITLDFDWVALPGLRFYGELLIDDVQFVWPVLISPELAPARWGAILGFHWVDALPEWSARFEYAVVPNWTYAATAASTHWMARGLPLGHPVGNDFDLWHLRFTRLQPADLEVWVSYLRKGEGRVDRFWSSPEQARGALFLTGVVEHSWVAGVEFGGTSAGWTYAVGPWVAHRTNAGHVPGATRLDWGVSLAAQLRY